jgi:predicted N-formylglutamate amidohydrolase
VVHASTTTRLLVDLNRSLGHPGLFSPITRALPALQRRQIVERHYRPHRDAFEAEVARAIAGGRRVVHIASHSFTPTLDGVPRHADVAWLYDPGRAAELAFACAWKADLAQRAPGLVLRRNYPYRGRSDGLTACLRKRHADADYLGIELEVNQRFVARGGAAWDELRAQLVASLAQTLEAAAGSASTVPGAAGR